VKMKLEEIRHKLTNGFRPFILHTSDGRKFTVPHKEFIMLTKRSVVVADKDGFVDILDPMHITGIRELAELPRK
jgi:hypothetical protein